MHCSAELSLIHPHPQSAKRRHWYGPKPSFSNVDSRWRPLSGSGVSEPSESENSEIESWSLSRGSMVMLRCSETCGSAWRR